VSGKATAAASGNGPGSDVSELAGHSGTVVVWTMAGRLTGFLRVALLSAVLGPTFFANLVQTVLVLPYLVCQLLMASLLPAILTPHLVRLIQAGERPAAYRLACSFFGIAIPFFGLAAVLTVLATPLILPLLTLAVEDPAVRAAQIELGWYLVLCLAPQIPLYGIASIGIAVQQAHHRFALSTAASAFENLGFCLVLVGSALLFGIGGDVDEVSLGQVLFLGIGSTLSVAAHAAVQWWGTARVGMPLRPQAGWRAPELRSELQSVLRMALPSSGNAFLYSFSLVAMLVVAGGIPGGAVAFQIAFNLFNLPIALCARPIATAQLPLLARRIAGGHAGAGLFHDALRLALFVTLPAILVFLLMADQLTSLVAFGGMRSETGMALVAASIIGLGLALLGEAVMVVSSSAAYARHDATSPFRAMVLQTGILFVGLLSVAALVAGPLRLTAIGVVFSAATIAGGIYLYRCQVPAGLAVAALWPAPVGILEALTSLGLAALGYLALQWLCRSSQLALLVETVRSATRGHAAPSPAGPNPAAGGRRR